MPLNQIEKELVCEFLTSAALADHLGDIRDAEGNLYVLLGIEHNELKDARSEADYNAFDTLKTLAERRNLPVPGYVLHGD